MWECGLKPRLLWYGLNVLLVTPYVGVWIETILNLIRTSGIIVTPYVGVWIETPTVQELKNLSEVTPYVGVWIETPIFAD